MVPFLELLDGMLKRGIMQWLNHTKATGPNWSGDHCRDYGRRDFYGDPVV
jgi:hypothetical protein